MHLMKWIHNSKCILIWCALKKYSRRDKKDNTTATDYTVDYIVLNCLINGALSCKSLGALNNQLPGLGYQPLRSCSPQRAYRDVTRPFARERKGLVTSLYARCPSGML